MTADYAQSVSSHRFDLLYTGNQLTALIETISGKINSGSRTLPFIQSIKTTATGDDF